MKSSGAHFGLIYFTNAMRIDIPSVFVKLRAFMATMLTKAGTVGAVGASTATQPKIAKVEAFFKDSTVLKYCVPNEHICTEIGRFLGLPVPPSALVYKAGHNPEHFFASLNFNLSPSALPPIDTARCGTTMAFETVGIVLFDVLIANEDRHRFNLSLDVSRNPPQLTVFDHSHALFGHQNGLGIARLVGVGDKLGIGTHCLLREINTDAFFGEWISRIRGLPNYLIDAICDATVPLGMITAGEAAAAKDFLKHRKGEIERIIRMNKAEFSAISHWSLLL